MPSERQILAGLGVLAATFWIASIFTDLGFYPLFHGTAYAPGTGWTVLEWGWLGPTAVSVAWFGNIPLLICVVMLLSGNTPSFRLATVSVGLAASGLLPVYTYDMVPGSTWTLVRGPAVWLWLASFVIAWLPAAHGRWVNGSRRIS